MSPEETKALVMPSRLPEDFIEETLIPHMENCIRFNIKVIGGGWVDERCSRWGKTRHNIIIVRNYFPNNRS